MRIFRRVVVFAALFHATAECTAQPAPQVPSSVAELVQRQVTVHWQGISLREACRRLADTQELPIFLDRRIDPQRPINLQAREQNLQQVASQLAEQAGAELALLPSLCYLGPSVIASELPTLMEIAREQMKRVPAASRRKLTQKQQLRWQRLATPQQILRDLTQPLGLKLAGSELLPHDRWDAGELPMAAVGEHLTLLLAGFDLTWRWDRDAIRIAAIERPVRIARSYNWRGVTAARLQQVAAELPAAKVQVSKGKVVLDGRVEDHEKLLGILSSLQQPQRRASGTARPVTQRKLYSLRLEGQPAGAVLRELARQLELELRVAEAALNEANLSLDKRISLAVTQVDLGALLEEIGKAAGLSIQATERALHVAPR